MIRAFLFNLVTQKPIYTLIYRLTYLAVPIGLIWIFLISNMADINKIEENAVHSDQTYQSEQEDYQKEIQNLKSQLDNNNQLNMSQFIIDYFNKYNMVNQVHEFQVETQNKIIEKGQNIYGIFKAPRSWDFECNLYSFDMSKSKYKSVAFVFALIHFYSLDKAKYISRDLLFLAYDSRFTKYGAAIDAFLKDYHSPDKHMARCGTIRQAVNLDLTRDFDIIIFNIFGLNGRVPDRDYFLAYNQLLNQGNVQFTYSDRTNRFEKVAQKKLENIAKSMLKLVGINYKYQIFNFDLFFNSLIKSIYGGYNDANSYFFQYGIQSISIRGYRSKQKSFQDDRIRLEKNLAYVIEAGNRISMALDEQLHAGSTLYYPTSQNQCLTIAKTVFPTITVCLSLAIMTLYFFIFNKQNITHWKIQLQYYTYVFHGFFLLKLPEIIEFIYQKFANKTFKIDIYWEDLNSPDLTKYVHWYLAALLISIPLFNFLFNNCILKQIFKVNISKQTKEDRIFFKYMTSIFIGLCSVYWLFYNVAFSYLVLLIYAPLILFAKRLIPRTKSIYGIILSLVNLIILSGVLYIIYSIVKDWDLLLMMKELLINYIKFGSQAYWFFVTSLVETSLLLLNIYFN